jgi:hypothetical protein
MLPLTSGRIYAETGSSVNTGIAISNPNATTATVSFFFTDSAGADFGTGTITIPPNGQTARFLDESPFNSGLLSRGTFTFKANVPIAVIALRSFTNERSESLFTRLPVVPLGSGNETAALAHWADGGGWNTEVILVNPFDESLAGFLQFYDQGIESPVRAVDFGNPGETLFPYSIPPNSSRKIQTPGLEAAMQSGSIRINPTAGAYRPTALVFFSLKRDGVTVAQGGVPPVRPSTSLRLYVETQGDFVGAQPGSIQTGVALANASSAPAVVVVETWNSDGTQRNEIGAMTVPGNGHVAAFLNQLPGMESLPPSFTGTIRLSTASALGIYIIGLRGRYNERGDFIFTTIAPYDDARPSTTVTASPVFAHWIFGGNFTTQFVLFSSTRSASTGLLQFFDQHGLEIFPNLR